MPVALYSFLYEVHNWDIAHRELPSAVDTSPVMNAGGPLQDFTAFFMKYTIKYCRWSFTGFYSFLYEVHNWGIGNRELLPAVDTSPVMNAGGPLQDFTVFFMKYTIGVSRIGSSCLP